MIPQMQKSTLRTAWSCCGHVAIAVFNFRFPFSSRCSWIPGPSVHRTVAGRTPLMRAAQLGVPRLCAALLAAKADVNAPGPQSHQAKEVMAVVELGNLPKTIYEIILGEYGISMNRLILRLHDSV